jgi:hypothetical protein
MTVEQILECIPHKMLVCDYTASVLHANKKWLSYCGLADGKAVFWSYVHPDDLAATKEKWDNRLTCSFEIIHRLHNGAGVYRYAKKILSNHNTAHTF